MRWLALLIAASWACAPARPVVVETTEPRTRPPPPPAEPQPQPTPQCPEALAAARPLEATLGDSIRPGRWHPTTESMPLGFVGTWKERFRAKVGPVELVGLTTRSIATVVLFTPHEGGACVVNAWTAYFPPIVEDVRLADHWTDGTRSIAVLQLRFQAAPSTWLVLGADKDGAWLPLQQQGRHQLEVRAMKLSPSPPKLYLDVVLTRQTRFVLRPNGRFERLGP